MKMKKILTLALCMCAFGAISAQAKTIQVTIDSDLAFIEDGAVSQSTLDVIAFIENDITMVPLRFISESLGAQVQWNHDTKEVTISKDVNTAVVKIGDVNAKVIEDSKEKTVVLNTAPRIINDYTVVPLRFVSEGLNALVEYVPETRQVIISDETEAVRVGDVKLTKNMFKSYYKLVSYLEPYYGKEGLAEALYNEIINNAAIYNIWKTIDPNCAINKETIDEIKKNDDSKWAEQGILNAELVRMMTILDVGANAYNIMSDAVEEDAINSFYKDNYVRAKHILISTINEKTGEPITDTQKKVAHTLAVAIKKELDNGANFDSLMDKQGQDPGAKQQPEGYVFTYGEMVEPFEKAAFALEEGKISDIVETDFGYHIIKREELPVITEELKEIIKGDISRTMLENMSQSISVTNNITKEEIIKYVID